jgi:hypothetical protein
MIKLDDILLCRLFIILIILVFIINLFMVNKFYDYENFINFNNSGFTTESASTGSLVCAKSCCFSGWPSSIYMDESEFGVKPGDIGVKYKTTNIKCNNGFTTGCVCKRI